MSLQSAEFMLRARRAGHRAQASSEELRAVLEAIRHAYEVLARVQEVLDEEDATYESAVTAGRRH
jgi:hypothetical protein